jgi:dipeptidase E
VGTRIIALGGGYPFQDTSEIDDHIVDSIRINGKEKPNFLFLPTATEGSKGTEDSEFYENYYEYIKDNFGNKRGCKVYQLPLKKFNRSSIDDVQKIQSDINSADIIYVSGGDPEIMMSRWREFGVDELLKKICDENKPVVLTGISAGCECWFKYGMNDHKRMVSSDKESPIDFEIIDCLGLVPGNYLVCPHYDQIDRREPIKVQVKKLAKLSNEPIIALDDCCAIEIFHNKFRILGNKETANVYRAGCMDGKYIEDKIQKFKYLPISELSLEVNI